MHDASSTQLEVVMSAAHRSSGEDFPQSILMAPSPRLNGSFSFSFEERRPAPFMYAYNLDDDERTYVRFPPPRRDPTLVDRPQSSRSTSGWHRQDRTPTTTATATADPTMTAEEFEALPAAVRRKYFSSLERLRFAQHPRPDALNDRPRQRLRKNSLAIRRGLEPPFLEPRRKASRTSRDSHRSLSVSSSDASWFMTLPEKIRQRQFTAEEQALLSGRHHETCILDAADEAIYKATRGASRRLNTSSNLDDYALPSPKRPSLDSYRTRGRTQAKMADSVYESFRWMDEEGDLDLKLDDYHANLDGAVIPTTDSPWRPSFRRQLSISKMPFNRRTPSLQSRPSLQSPPATASKASAPLVRQRSRMLSLVTPKHAPKASLSSIDPGATHYQDPEARLKLRVYLASPQKFDEAIEFGFPSIEGLAEDKENKAPRISGDIIGRRSSSTEKEGSFWKDVEMSSLFDDDDDSMLDPESPRTPMFVEPLTTRHQARPSTSIKDTKTTDFSHLGITKPTLIKQPDSHGHAVMGSREMTLRMTLTRPDLRADESTLYGWQANNKSPLAEEPLTWEEADGKAEMRGPFGGMDGWGVDEKENGVVKRFWNKVKSSQRKVS